MIDINEIVWTFFSTLNEFQITALFFSGLIGFGYIMYRAASYAADHPKTLFSKVLQDICDCQLDIERH